MKQIGLILLGLVALALWAGTAAAFVQPCALIGNATFSPLHPGPEDHVAYAVSLPATLFDQAPQLGILVGPASVTADRIDIDVVLTDDIRAFPGYHPVSVKYQVDSVFGELNPLAPGTYAVRTSVRGKDPGTGGYVDLCAPKDSRLTIDVVPAAVTTASVVEFYNDGLDHYFMTQSEAEIRDLDTGKHPGWARTGQSFTAYVREESDGRGRATCRWYGLPSAGLDTHFFSASLVECDALRTDPLTRDRWQLETFDAFEIPLPDTTTGACRNGTIPVYRLWNGRADSNHRYTTQWSTRAEMVAKGYVPEGFGPDGVAMCATPPR